MKKYLILNLLTIILLGIYIILLLLKNEKAYLIGIPAFGLFVVISIINLIKEKKDNFTKKSE